MAAAVDSVRGFDSHSLRELGDQSWNAAHSAFVAESHCPTAKRFRAPCAGRCRAPCGPWGGNLTVHGAPATVSSSVHSERPLDRQP